MSVNLLNKDISSLRSINNMDWCISNYDERLYTALMQKFSLPEIIAKILARKELSLNDVENYLNPTIKSSLPDPFSLLDMEKAVSRILQAIEKKEKITIFGDYDVDGATSSALIMKFFYEGLSIKCECYIPDRMKEGYGPNIDAFRQLKDNGTDLIITVDCGTLSFDVLDYAKTINLDVIVIDHHLADPKLPNAVAIINPNRIDEKSGLGYLAAVGVSFLFIVAINTKIKTKINLINYLDLVALGTVCDVVPLIGLNRAYVCQGLKILAKRKNIGLAMLSDIASISTIPGTYHLGFVLGPMINAGGRVGESYLGSRLLSTSKIEDARIIGNKLHSYNQERKSIEKQVYQEALEQCIKSKDHICILYGEKWHVGVIGIVAGRLKEQFNKPIIVISLKNGIGKASCRSIKNIDIGAAIISARIENILKDGGGHAMAAGFTILEENIELLRKYLNDRFRNILANRNDFNKRYFDGFLSIDSININMVNMIQKLGPFGSGNSEPRFIIKNVFMVNKNIFAEQHLSVILCSSLAANTGRTIIAKIFRIIGSKLENILYDVGKKNYHVVGIARINSWMGQEKLEFIIEDIIYDNQL